jgi:hypothetical protein
MEISQLIQSADRCGAGGPSTRDLVFLKSAPRRGIAAFLRPGEHDWALGIVSGNIERGKDRD